MTQDLSNLLLMASVVGCALVGGIFFTFSNFVMGALRRLPPAQGAAAMQSINVTVLNPLFFGLFFGTGAAALAAAVLSTEAAAAFAAVGAAAYLLGCVAVTGVKNVPLNNALASVDPALDAGRTFGRDTCSTGPSGTMCGRRHAFWPLPCSSSRCFEGGLPITKGERQPSAARSCANIRALPSGS